jgi:hypothetical protein
MSKELDRILKLIALTASPNENEARNAAFLATKLIREHKIVLRDPGSAPAQHVRFPTPQPRPQPPPPRPPPVNRPTKLNDFMGRTWNRYPANRFDDSFCRNCGEQIPMGTPATWLKGEGSYHDECWSSSWRNKPQTPPRPPPRTWTPPPRPEPTQAPFTDEDLKAIFGDD